MSYNRNFSEPERSIKGPILNAPEYLMRKDRLVKTLFQVAQRFMTAARHVKHLSPDVIELPAAAAFLSFELRSELEFIDYVNVNPAVLAGLTATGIPVAADRINVAIVNDNLTTVYLSSSSSPRV
mmetsp:Transcript_41002/g.101188  ORF Transcript_41002/g.101188 Transcript_41002/m.101188 type:complete len:125 (-) Transcript_41002:1037-1411(-)